MTCPTRDPATVTKFHIFTNKRLRKFQSNNMTVKLKRFLFKLFLIFLTTSKKYLIILQPVITIKQQ
jgi:hypothetical protein